MKQPLVVCTKQRGVFFGYGEIPEKDVTTIRLTSAGVNGKVVAHQPSAPRLQKRGDSWELKCGK